MYRREPNYFLALTGGLSYLCNAYIAYKFGAPVAAAISTGLAITSMWFHSIRDDTSFWADQAFVYAYVLAAGREAWERGMIEFGILLIGAMNTLLLYFVGQMGSCYAFSPEVEVATAYHAYMHVGSATVVSTILAGSNVLLLGDGLQAFKTNGNLLSI